MKIHDKTVIVYDIEVFPNVFHCTCLNTETKEKTFYEISERTFQLEELTNFFTESSKIFCGYNNIHYDNIIINYIIKYKYRMYKKSYYDICKSIYNLSQIIIKDEEKTREQLKEYKYAKYFYSFDLLTMMFSSKLRVGLKSMQITMHYRNVQEYDGNFEDILLAKDIPLMKLYNINDVESTEELLNKLEEDIKLRLYIQEEYDIDCLSMDNTKIGEKILEKKYCESTGISLYDLKQMRSPADYIDLKDVILPFIHYKNPKLQDALSDMKRQTVYTKERKSYENKFVISNTVYSIGVGGIHSINKPEIFLPKDDEYIGHSDVASMYPSFIIKYKWIPQHLGKEFWQIYSKIYDERIEAKHNHQSGKNIALKYALNAVTGKMQQETSWMYDPLSVFKIRINGQLILLMLVDQLLELNCKIVQVNTDGVMYIAKEKDRDRVQEAISNIEKLTQLVFESDEYEAFYQYAVNDYFGVIKGYTQSKDPKLIEKKGMFITKNNLGKGLSPTIIPKAVINYFLTGESVEHFIKNHTDIKDFLMTQAVDKKFNVEYGDERVQRINRYYASTNGRYLYKVKEENGKLSYTNMLTKSGITILNVLDDKPIKERHINYIYYISEANKIINNFVCQQLSLF